MYKEPEVAIANLGIDVDFTGLEGSPNGTITWEEFDAVNKEYPRMRFSMGRQGSFLGCVGRSRRPRMITSCRILGRPTFLVSRKGHTLGDVAANSTLPNSF